MKKQSLIKGSLVLGLAGMVAKVLGFFFRWPLIMLIGDEGIGYYQLSYPLYMFFVAMASGVPVANSPTLGTYYSPRMRRADIEVPNLPVDVDSWGRSACYPRGSFYPLSDGPPTRYHRITKPDFRPCSTCRSRSQAPFCLCTLRTISDRSEGTFGRLRYFLGGDRPSQTAHLTMSSHQFHGVLLEPQYCQGGIPRLTPLRLTP